MKKKTNITEIARGGFGIVEKIEFSTGRVVARKKFEPQPDILAVTSREKLIKRFIREVLIQEEIAERSKYFLPIEKYKLDTENPWFIMPLAEKNYREQIKIDRSDGDINIIAISDILSGLEELHSLGYTHRDLKPENILFYDGIWRLSDFGLIKPPASSSTTKSLTSVNSAWGTDIYCAPEQVTDFHNVDVTADIFSLGCILHDLVCGEVRLPYQKLIFDGHLGTIIEKCTEVDPSKRFQSIVNLREILMEELITPPEESPSVKGEEWAEYLTNEDKWDSQMFKGLIKYLNNSDKPDSYSIFRNLSVEKIQNIYDIFSDFFKPLALIYCEWAFGSSFQFEYCDVIASRLKKIYELGDIECKVSAVISVAQLGVYHNRWYVMKKLFDMAGHNIDNKLAKRIAIEIAVGGYEIKNNLLKCAEIINRSVDDYHPEIQKQLNKKVTI